MRICIITIAGHGVGGMQDHTRDLSAGLAGAGHDVEVITARDPEGRRETLVDGVLWRFVDAPGLHMDARWRRASYAEFERRGPFDLVHSEGSSGLELVRRGVHHRVPTVTMFHGNFVGLARAGLQRMLRARRPRPAAREARALAHLCGDHFPNGNWRVFRGCEAIVPSRQQFRDTCRSHLLDPARVHVVPNGVDASRFRPRPREETRALLGLSEDFTFVCVGRLNREKGMHHALRALARLRADGSGPRLVIVGEGEERAALEQLAAELEVGDRTVFAGAQPAEQVASYLAAADAFLFPTERDEAAPYVLPQAMACGIPVVASRIGGIPEVANRPGENALLVSPGDDDELVGAMSALLRDAGLRERLGAGAREDPRGLHARAHDRADARGVPDRAGAFSPRRRRAGVLRGLGAQLERIARGEQLHQGVGECPGVLRLDDRPTSTGRTSGAS